MACSGAKDAVAFFSAYGFNAGMEIEIQVVNALPGSPGTSAVAFYVEDERRVYALSLVAMQERGTWFGVPLDRVLYRSILAHEASHALADRHFRVDRASIQAKEYVAYVAMFSTMEPKRRQRLLARFPGQGYEGEWQMSTTVYMMDPLRFGVQAYRHFLRPGNGAAFLREVFAGRVLAAE